MNSSTLKALSVGGLLLAAGVAASTVAVTPRSADALPAVDAYAHLPSTMALNAVIRDFKYNGTSGGHPDFQRYSGSTTVGLVSDTLGSDLKPVPVSLRGRKITTEFKDSAGRNINPALYSAARGDRLGATANGGTDNGITSFQSFNQWYNDTPGVNMSKNVQLTLNRVAGTNRYVFDSAVDEPYRTRGGFFPINADLLGNQGSSGKNFAFTTEVITEFTYSRGQGQVFRFTGDDDVWVFIGDKLVIDLGGLHSQSEQWIDLDRLAWLQDQQLYTLRVFHAERRESQSNFRIETTLQLRAVEPPAVSGTFD